MTQTTVNIGFLVVFVCVLTGCDRVLFNEDTRFSPGYSDKNFKAIRKSMSSIEVVQLLGMPFEVWTQQWSEVWSYLPCEVTTKDSPFGKSYNFFGKFTHVYFAEDGTVRSTSGDYLPGNYTGLTRQQVLATLGEPSEHVVTQFEVVYRYTFPGKSGTYRKREVRFDGSNRVSRIVAETYYD